MNLTPMDLNTMGRFTEAELEIAAAVASWRLKNALIQGYGAGHGEAHNKGFHRDLTGALGELAFAKLMHMYWGGTADDFGRYGDVGGYEIRATTHNEGHLIVFPNDPNDRMVVLVVVKYPAFRVVGCILAGDAKQEAHEPPAGALRPGSPLQWWVPQSALKEV